MSLCGNFSRFLEDCVLQLGAQSQLCDDLNLDSKQLLERNLHSQEIEERGPFSNVDKKVQVTVGSLGSSSPGAKNLDGCCPMGSSYACNFFEWEFAHGVLEDKTIR